MSLQYGEIPAGELISVPPAIPSGMLHRVKQIMGARKRTLELVPLAGQSMVCNGGKMVEALRPNSTVYLGTFESNFRGYTSHGGNASGSTWATTPQELELNRLIL